MKVVACAVVAALAAVGGLAEPKPWTVTVDSAAVVGMVKPVNAVNGGPPSRFGSDNADWRNLRVPYARTHDMNHCWSNGGPHTIDVDAVFPNFDADENEPESYDFFYTDLSLATMKAYGIEPFFRLGPSIEGGAKKYHTHPPKDFAKWARVCEHIIRHCNEGWANGRRDGIRHWEIWFEPDIGAAAWTGTKEQFLAFYKTAAIHLKSRFPALKIGGPAFAHSLSWKDDFIPFCRREHVPLDFYSWHWYGTDVRDVARRAREVRAWLDENGFGKTESILDEWNYVAAWKGGEWAYSRQVESGPHIQKGMAFAAAMLAICQDAQLELAMYYDTRVHGGMNMLFEPVANRPQKGYYPFYAWSKLRCDYGMQVKATADVPDEKGVPAGQLYVTAAKDAHGKVAVWLARYADDDNVHDWRAVKVRLPKAFASRRAYCHLTDDVHAFTEVPVVGDADGAFELTLLPCSFAFLEVAGSEAPRSPAR